MGRYLEHPLTEYVDDTHRDCIDARNAIRRMHQEARRRLGLTDHNTKEKP